MSEPILGRAGSDYRQQGGLLDVPWRRISRRGRRLWLSFSKLTEGGHPYRRRDRKPLSEDMSALEDVTEIFLQMPASPNPMHFGSRVQPEPGTGNVLDHDGRAFQPGRAAARPGTGDDLWQGRPGRWPETGAAPEDNPFMGDAAINAIWSYGHRNVQGPRRIPKPGRSGPWNTGRAAGTRVNRPEPGANHGWPVISYGINYNGSDVGSGEAGARGHGAAGLLLGPGDRTGGVRSSTRATCSRTGRATS